MCSPCHTQRRRCWPARQADEPGILFSLKTTLNQKPRLAFLKQDCREGAKLQNRLREVEEAGFLGVLQLSNVRQLL